MERFKEIRNKMLRQMAFSIVTMAAIPASHPHAEIREISWNMPGQASSTISNLVITGKPVTDCDKEPGQSGC